MHSPSEGGTYLMFKFLQNGSLDTFFQDDDRRALLSAHTRVQIMFEVIRSPLLALRRCFGLHILPP